MNKKIIIGLLSLIMLIMLCSMAVTAEETIKDQPPEFYEEVNNILSWVNPSMSDVEKVLAVHEYFVLNYSYGHNKIDLVLEPGIEYTSYGIMVNKIGVCQGYTQAFKYIMDKLSIPCTIVISGAMDHSWNMVSIDNKWYHVDVTWDDNGKTGGGMHQNLLLSDTGIAIAGHYGWESDLIADSTKYDNAFWINTMSYILPINGDWYYIDGAGITIQHKYGFRIIDHSKSSNKGVIKKYNFGSDTHNTIYTVPSQTYTYDDCGMREKTTWNGNNTSIAVDNEKIYYNTHDKIYSLDTKGKGKSLVCTVDHSDIPLSNTSGIPYIKGIEIKNGTIYYESSNNSNVYVATLLSNAVPTYIITSGSGVGGHIYPSGNIDVTRNKSRSFIIRADDGCKLTDVLIDGVSQGAISEYIFDSITENHSIQAVFEVADDK